MFVQVINVRKEKNKNLIGNIYKVKGTKISEDDGSVCFTMHGTRKIFRILDCRVLPNVIPLKKGA
jgi:hypothetical protein